ncbi:cytochrome oxidase assembly protein ShyY1 [Okibacterium sp. HSC-33S16]|uniref:SURF1 family cytochrome oxidase biogenesis protein n=1 Tax=Okibacterium sp. HSC-33S16 TaxID=2910965 RepID=UPI00209EFF31|nr:SURF1 family protein [Okibacterium sp. HSC-33S16]MCP2030930.1 cytochrome oxidase assembly protein ShyY1 [Okibacterium sp. HSC-33S16]
MSRRWFGYLAVATVFAIVCVLLANWQLSRKDEKAAEIALVESNYDRAPVPLGEVVPTREAFDDVHKWVPVTVTGTYLEEEQLLVRNRPRSGQPGFELLVPLQLGDGTVFIVDRGWLPTGNEHDLPDVIPSAPSGEVTVVARLKAGEPSLPGRSAAEGQIATVNLDDLQERLDVPLYTGAYGLLESETPRPTDEPPLPALKPVLDEGMHLSYAFQWFIFGILGFAFLAYAIREEYRHLNADDPDEQRRAAERERKRAAKRSDANVEDELLDGARSETVR